MQKTCRFKERGTRCLVYYRFLLGASGENSPGERSGLPNICRLVFSASGIVGQSVGWRIEDLQDGCVCTGQQKWGPSGRKGSAERRTRLYRIRNLTGHYLRWNTSRPLPLRRNPDRAGLTSESPILIFKWTLIAVDSTSDYPSGTVLVFHSPFFS